MHKLVIASLLIFSTAALADPPAKKPVAKGFWKALVKPNAKWVLKDTMAEKGPVAQIVVETYDVRKVGEADVARLRWTYVEGKEKHDYDRCGGCFTQVAVTAAGLYILGKEQDDGQVAEELKHKPSRSDPPKPYEATKRNEGRYLNLDTSDPAGAVACLGSGLPPGMECEDGTCFGEVCVSSSKGVVAVEGNYTPTEGPFRQEGYGK
jgi:hypothetical protein